MLAYLVLDLSEWQPVFGFVRVQGVEGLMPGFVFQLARVIEGTAFAVPFDDTCYFSTNDMEVGIAELKRNVLCAFRTF
ncbi:hypothetical protein [Larkinella insperata]|uniref:hypothetical protein n=1 Tax=Larkinella insperata TaxID=332158 RepID=UPI0036D3F6FD